MNEATINKAKKIIEGQYDRNPLCDSFLRLHSFTTENQKELLNLFEYKDTSNLLICDDSSDQILNLISRGCNYISVLSSNPFVAHYYELKKAALCSLKQREYLSFFLGLDDNNESSLFDKDIYNDISSKMRIGARQFWNALFSKYDPLTIKTKLFLPDQRSKEKIIQNNDYLDIGKYNELKSRMSDTEIKIYQDSIPNLSYIEEEFNYIFLSNYLERLLDLKDAKDYALIMTVYIEYVNILKNRLKKDGVMCYQYVHDAKNSYLDGLFDKYLSSISKRIYIPSADNVEGQVDGAYIIRKRTLK